MTPTLYSFWLPIVQFQKIGKKLEEKNIFSEYKSNSTWHWLKFQYENALIIIDSLGYIYIESKRDNKRSVLNFIETILNDETNFLINETFLNSKIRHPDNHIPIANFMESVSIKISSYSNLKIEYISSKLLHNEEKICGNNKIKFSLDNENPIEDTTFYQILNRNFCQLLNKSIYFTHGLEFEEGEIYDFSIFDKKQIEPLLKNIQESNISLKINNVLNEDILTYILKKALQNTIEERTILHFLKITKKQYLDRILEKILLTNNALSKLNSYLLATPHNNDNLLATEIQDFDEEDIEIFIQNILRSIPKFHSIESKIQETYYIKVGNITTSMKIEKNETITHTFFYTKWKTSIQYFMETVDNIKESLKIYHQNKNLKELEDISYNANYQADIEDIRNLKNNDKNILDENTKIYINIILFIFAIITLVGEAPLYPEIIEHLQRHFFNIILYSAILLPIIFFIKFLRKKNLNFVFFKNNFFSQKINLENIYIFEESDYDKHEHRSNKSLYTLNDGKESKIIISYNDVVSAYTLIKKLKAIKVTKAIKKEFKTFSIFPQLLRNIPLHNQYTFRENYRISRNDKVTTKIMFRYKITDLFLKEFLQLIRNDNFVSYYTTYLEKEQIENEDFSKNSLAKCLKLKNRNIQDSKLNLYVVYSFILKLNKIAENNCDYSVVKDQFRVHYHINELHYTNQQDLEEQQECLAQLIYIYFLARLKKFA